MVDTADIARPYSCHLLEFSVLPGGARLGNIYVAGDADELRECVDGDWEEGADGYLILWYGALLHLWTVQHGAIVAGLDLHPYLRTGDARCDLAVARVLDGSDDEERRETVQEVLMAYAEAERPTASGLPVVARMFDLFDRIDADPADSDALAELDRILDLVEGGDPPASYDGVSVEGLHIDWDAVPVPALHEPVLREGRVSVRWGDASLRHRASHLHHSTPTSEGTDFEHGFTEGGG
ncbi:hypothetical protein [Spirillospora sp. NBC_01491]|uniref:hypothetical protein n=1 Tax=Spirillospora sp. NBC_01491 TaxID=2976007 RepID=UPI002E346C41|nr:hypothetical protein [Spirillospora sp. NBC_01491]